MAFVLSFLLILLYFTSRSFFNFIKLFASIFIDKIGIVLMLYHFIVVRGTAYYGFSPLSAKLIFIFVSAMVLVVSFKMVSSFYTEDYDNSFKDALFSFVGVFLVLCFLFNDDLAYSGSIIPRFFSNWFINIISILIFVGIVSVPIYITRQENQDCIVDIYNAFDALRESFNEFLNDRHFGRRKMDYFDDDSFGSFQSQEDREKFWQEFEKKYKEQAKGSQFNGGYRENYKRANYDYNHYDYSDKAVFSEERLDYYKILNVSSDASIDQIKRSYRALAKKYHPDISKEPDAEEMFKRINAAYDVLSDKDKKARYDSGENV